jgi:hypothetical protein
VRLSLFIALSLLVSLGTGLAVAFAACWLAFYPPAWYRRSIEGGPAAA